MLYYKILHVEILADVMVLFVYNCDIVFSGYLALLSSFRFSIYLFFFLYDPTCQQVTVMSAACAERCGLTSRIDTAFAGRAVGVGFARILGRIHDANIR